MKTWILTIIGTAILITIAEILLPSGRMKNVTRSIFGILVMIAVLKPLPNLKNADWQLEFDLPTNQVFLEQMNERKVAALEKNGEKILNEAGYPNCKVTLSGEWTDKTYTVRSAIINTVETLSQDAIDKLAEYYRIRKDAVVIYGVS